MLLVADRSRIALTSAGHRRPTVQWSALFVVLALGVAGCTRPEPNTPEEVVRAYASALERGRADRAYALLSDEAKREVPFAVYERMLRENPREVESLAARLEAVPGPARVTATITTADGEELLLVLEEGKWRVDASAVELYGQRTPRQALESFVRALERRRYDVLLRFVPTDKAGDLTARDIKSAWEGDQRDEMQALGEALRLALPTGTLELVGDRATFAFGAGGTVELVRERGVWKVEDVVR